MADIVQVGPTFVLFQNVIYALPTYRCSIFSAAGGATLQQSGSVDFVSNVALTLGTDGSAFVTGGFIRNTGANLPVVFKKGS